MNITVIKRSDDYMAYFDDNPRLWDCGKTPEEAIGKLVISCKHRFNVLITTGH